MIATDTQVSGTIRVKYMRERYTGCKSKLTSYAHFNRGGVLKTLKSKGSCLIWKSNTTMTVTNSQRKK